LRDIYVRSPGGQQVPLNAIAHYGPAIAPLSVNHQGLFPSVTISFNLQPGVALGDAEAAVDAAARKIGLPPTIQTMFTGTAAAYQDSLNSEPYLIAAALAAVYLMLGILYESYIHPGHHSFHAPLGGGGRAAGSEAHQDRPQHHLHDRHHSADRPGKEERHPDRRFRHGRGAHRAQESARRHFRGQPAALPPHSDDHLRRHAGRFAAGARGPGTGSELRRPLGITIIGGLLMSQALTLFTTPVVYLYFDRFQHWWERVRGSKRRPLETIESEG
jgi:hypothetical protein